MALTVACNGIDRMFLELRQEENEIQESVEFGDPLEEEGEVGSVRESNFTEKGESHHHRRLGTATSTNFFNWARRLLELFHPWTNKRV